MMAELGGWGRTRLRRPLWLAINALVLCLLGGCARLPLGNAPLTVATPWPRSDCARLERAYNDWLSSKYPDEDRPSAIHWIFVAPGDDLLRLAVPHRQRFDWRAQPLDLMLGGPASVYRQLEREGQLVGGDSPNEPAWRVTRRLAVGWAHNRRVDRSNDADDPEAPFPSLSKPDTLAFDDPRHDALALAWARSTLASTTWDDGYRALVKAAAHATRIGRQPGAARGAVERGEAAVAPALPFETVEGPIGFIPGASSLAWIEGVAIVAGGDNPTTAQRFLEFLATNGQAEMPRSDDTPRPEVDGLLADLLGATLVDAQNELVPAWGTWERAGRPKTQGQWLTEAPPWPPASIDKLLKTPGAGPLLETLAHQIAPDARSRAWLMQSWLAPPQQVDGPLLEQLATAHEGRLVAEPRFRAWLRGEWTAWARQRYRRVERQLTTNRTPLALGSP